jgi:hypothetical protein
MQKQVIGILGFIGSGKGTVGEYLSKQYGYMSISFASSLKDAIAVIFNWPRHLLEGDTTESRSWREEIDQYWSKKMDRPVTPRWVLQHLGTDVLRNHFFDGIWIASLENKILQYNNNVVITDVRFPNEIKLVRELQGKLWWVQRGDLPEWYQCAESTPVNMPIKWPLIHSSEYEWVSCGPFTVLDNNGTLTNLYNQVDSLI